LIAYGLPETLATLSDCLFNGRVWPDYTAMPSPTQPFLRLQPLAVGESVRLGSRVVTPLPVRHAVPAVGYRLDSGAASLVFSGDTTFSEAFWDSVNAIDNLAHIIVETTFLNDNERGCDQSGHTNARRLAQGLARLTRPASLHITHMEPGREEQTWQEVCAAAAAYRPQRLQPGQVIEF
jgi:ribonuclease BN (tRNA processing enzyme)